MPIDAPFPVNHNRSHFSNQVMIEQLAAIEDAEADAMYRARWNAALKSRLVLKIPYHEWQEAVRRAGLRWGTSAPRYDIRPINELLKAYRPIGFHVTRACVDAPRYAPWATRNERGPIPINPDEILAHVRAHIDRITGAWGSLRASFERVHRDALTRPPAPGSLRAAVEAQEARRTRLRAPTS